VLADIDALLTERQAVLAASGATLSRNALLLTLLRYGLRAARGGEATTPPTPPEASEAPPSVPVAADAAPPVVPAVDVVIPDPDPEPAIRPPPSSTHPNLCLGAYAEPEVAAEWTAYEADNRQYHEAHRAWCQRNDVPRAECQGCYTRKNYPSYKGDWCNCGRLDALHRRTHPNTPSKAAQPLKPPDSDPEPQAPIEPRCLRPERNRNASQEDRAAWLNYREALVRFRAEHQAWARRQQAPVTTKPPSRVTPKCFGCRMARKVSPLEPTPSCTCGRRLGAAVLADVSL
jgi:hypothetical protein